MDTEFKQKWVEFEITENRVFTRLDKELAHKWFVLGRDGSFPGDKVVVPGDQPRV
jgi:hypothetical protein